MKMHFMDVITSKLIINSTTMVYNVFTGKFVCATRIEGNLLNE